MSEKFTLYSFPGSQWAGVPLLTIAQKGLTKDDYDLINIDLITAGNFDPSYVKINPNGTIPSITAPSLPSPLTESTDTLRYLDRDGSLQPSDAVTKERVKAILHLVHGDDVGTNTILVNARSPEEMAHKRAGVWTTYVSNRINKLQTEHAADPKHPFYSDAPRLEANRSLAALYTAPADQLEDEAHRRFYALSDKLYRSYAEGVDRFEKLLVLPYAAGDKITEADFHAAPWLAHAMWGAETPVDEIQNFEALEKLVQKTVPEFRVGPRTREWWANIAATEAFKAVFPTLH